LTKGRGGEILLRVRQKKRLQLAITGERKKGKLSNRRGGGGQQKEIRQIHRRAAGNKKRKKKTSCHEQKWGKNMTKGNIEKTYRRSKKNLKIPRVHPTPKEGKGKVLAKKKERGIAVSES